MNVELKLKSSVDEKLQNVRQPFSDQRLPLAREIHPVFQRKEEVFLYFLLDLEQILMLAAWLTPVVDRIWQTVHSSNKDRERRP